MSANQQALELYLAWHRLHSRHALESLAPQMRQAGIGSFPVLQDGAPHPRWPRGVDHSAFSTGKRNFSYAARRLTTVPLLPFLAMSWSITVLKWKVRLPLVRPLRTQSKRVAEMNKHYHWNGNDHATHHPPFLRLTVFQPPCSST